MHRILRAIAPVILVIFISTSLVSPALGQANDKDKIGDVEISRTIYLYDLNAGKATSAVEKPRTGDVIMLDLKVQGKGNQITEVDMIQNAFALINSFDEQDASPWVHRKAFILRSPNDPGIYSCIFKCTDKNGDSVLISSDIEVIGSIQPPVIVPATSEVIVPDKGKPGSPFFRNKFKILPIGSPGVVSPEKQAPLTGTVTPESRYYGSSMRVVHTTHMYMGSEWGMFWFGLLAGVIIASLAYSASAAK